MEPMESTESSVTHLRAAVAPDVFDQALRDNDPRVRVVSQRVMRRVIRHCHEVIGFGFQIPTRQAFAVAREALLEHVSAGELSPTREPLDSLPPVVLLIGRPDPDVLAQMPEDDAWLLAWRLLFEAHIEGALRARELSLAEVRQRLAALGQIETDEIRAVLRQERRLIPPGDDLQLYPAFATFYLERRYFEPPALSRYFPSLESLAAADAVLARDLDAAALFAAARPDGARETPDTGEEHDDIKRRQLRVRERSMSAFREALDEGRDAADVGNAARAALQMTLALAVVPRAAPAEQLDEARAGAEAQLQSLAERLQRIFAESTEVSAWVDALRPLLTPAIDGHWSQEARLLYDLQKLCVEHERARFKLDLPGFLVTLGRRPLRRPLPIQQMVLQVKHLRSARGRLSAAHIRAGERSALRGVLTRAEKQLERELRQRLRPGLVETLDRVGLAPANPPEDVALDKLIDELLDRAVKRGFLAIGDLRDALSRNNLKLQDLRLREVLGNDALLAADRKLARDLEGLYRPGEVYLRGLQRVSSVTFGTRVGRWLTRYLALPFGGAFVILEGLQHIVGPLIGLLGGTPPTLMSRPALVALGVVLLGVLYWSAFRSTVVSGLRLGLRGLRAVFVQAPKWFFSRPLVRRFLRSAAMRALWRFVIKPAIFSALLWVALTLSGAELPFRYLLLGAAGAFLGFNLILNSRLGRDAQEIAVDSAVRAWFQLRGRILPGIIKLILELFRRLLGGFERLLYTVDEWLRFKQGESLVVLILKALLAVIWGVVTYIARIYITLLVEPQVNPIKHFPVVTVSHKIILPFTLRLTVLLAAPLTPIFGDVMANTIAGFTVFLLPGVFGFLVWELKENWKLYDASRPATLRPVLVGSHGETMLQFMRPGFHSGTLPKLFAKLRRAERRALRGGRWRKSQKLRTELHHVEESIAVFVDREFLALLRRSRDWRDTPLSIGQVQVGSNRIRVGIARGPDEPALYLAFEEQSGLLLASVTAAGWSSALPPAQHQTLRNALIGLYKMAGVELTREQLSALLPAACAYDVDDDGLLLWPTEDFGTEVRYHIHEPEERFVPELIGPAPDGLSLSPLADAELRFARNPVTWSQWVTAWRDTEAPRLLTGQRLLPASDS